jgi:hypothetical protein
MKKHLAKIVVGTAAVLLAQAAPSLAQGPVQGPVLVYNPYTCSYGYQVPPQNPYVVTASEPEPVYNGYTGGVYYDGAVAAAAAYNPYRGYGTTGEVYRNPYTGAATVAGAYHNPYTGVTGAGAAYHNPYTGATAARTGSYNPATGTATRSAYTYNPYTGTSREGSVSYNHYTGDLSRSGEAYNHYTGGVSRGSYGGRRR